MTRDPLPRLDDPLTRGKPCEHCCVVRSRGHWWKKLNPQYRKAYVDTAVKHLEWTMTGDELGRLGLLDDLFVG